jgi:hypothetical protein
LEKKLDMVRMVMRDSDAVYRRLFRGAIIPEDGAFWSVVRLRDEGACE